MIKKDRSNSNKKRADSNFYCPLSPYILWHRGMEYGVCPLYPSHRDFQECKSCKLRVDKEWENNKETWQDEPRKKKKRPQRRKNKKGAQIPRR